MSSKSAIGRGGKNQSFSTCTLLSKSMTAVVLSLFLLIAENFRRSLGEWLWFLVHLMSAHTPFLKITFSWTLSQKCSVFAFCMAFDLSVWACWYLFHVSTHQLVSYWWCNFLAVLVSFAHFEFQNSWACGNGFFHGTICSTIFCNIKMIWHRYQYLLYYREKDGWNWALLLLQVLCLDLHFSKLAFFSWAPNPMKDLDILQLSSNLTHDVSFSIFCTLLLQVFLMQIPNQLYSLIPLPSMSPLLLRESVLTPLIVLLLAVCQLCNSI